MPSLDVTPKTDDSQLGGMQLNLKEEISLSGNKGEREKRETQI